MTDIISRFRLDNRVALITGASSGPGVSFATGLAHAGGNVVLVARRGDKLEETAGLVRSAGRKALCVTADVSDPEQCDRAVAAAISEFGQLDILVNNAGIGAAYPATREGGSRLWHFSERRTGYLFRASGRNFKKKSLLPGVSPDAGVQVAERFRVGEEVPGSVQGSAFVS